MIHWNFIRFFNYRKSFNRFQSREYFIWVIPMLFYLVNYYNFVVFIEFVLIFLNALKFLLANKWEFIIFFYFIRWRFIWVFPFSPNSFTTATQKLKTNDFSKKRIRRHNIANDDERTAEKKWHDYHGNTGGVTNKNKRKNVENFNSKIEMVVRFSKV